MTPLLELDQLNGGFPLFTTLVFFSLGVTKKRKLDMIENHEKEKEE